MCRTNYPFEVQIVVLAQDSAASLRAEACAHTAVQMHALFAHTHAHVRTTINLIRSLSTISSFKVMKGRCGRSQTEEPDMN